MNVRSLAPVFLVLAIAWRVSSAWAISISLDYSNDTFFAAHPVAKTSLEAAAQYVSSLITTPLAATSDLSSAKVVNSTVDFNFSFTYPNPTTGAMQTIDPAVIPSNQVRVYVGVQKLNSGEAGATILGGVNVNANASYFNQPDLTAAFNNAQAAANANLLRGGGPTIGNVSGTLNSAFGNLPFSINFGSTVSSSWFDVDTNNDGAVDSDAQLNAYWQFDYTKPVGSTQIDFYSVAEHELLHALGFGQATSWKNRISPGPQDWSGAQVNQLLGIGHNVLSADGGHVAGNLLSTRLTDGVVQQSIMSPIILSGTRKGVTRLDLAFLRDMGWDTIAYPFLPGDFNEDNHRTSADVQAMMSALTNLSGYKSANGLSNSDLLALGDLNGDQAVTNADLQSLLNLLAGGGGALQGVPEPGSFWLLGSGGVLFVSYLKLRRRIPDGSKRNFTTRGKCSFTNRSC